ncbi:FAS1-like dehydratase domain-containing protein [Virgibacillus siamensis]|uniref:FAS1-like dehydratase domain-containing protein n=1 Tax=Virgibacillus siamensis TaxID=480071 RepID=UPI000985BDB7|nr:MaoC family dehydratase N-terminal domain-containing protein [Virgibacillus siamensis]
MITEGLVTEKVDIMITREMIRTYCNAIGETNAIYHSTKAAKAAGYTDLVIPPAYPTLFWQDINIPWLSNQSSIIQSSQTFDYQEPLTANMTYTCFIKLTKVRTSGNKQFLQHKLYITYNHTTAATSITTLVRPGHIKNV